VGAGFEGKPADPVAAESAPDEVEGPRVVSAGESEECFIGRVPHGVIDPGGQRGSHGWAINVHLGAQPEGGPIPDLTVTILGQPHQSLEAGPGTLVGKASRGGHRDLISDPPIRMSGQINKSRYAGHDAGETERSSDRPIHVSIIFLGLQVDQELGDRRPLIFVDLREEAEEMAPDGASTDVSTVDLACRRLEGCLRIGDQRGQDGQNRLKCSSFTAISTLPSRHSCCNTVSRCRVHADILMPASPARNPYPC